MINNEFSHLSNHIEVLNDTEKLKTVLLKLKEKNIGDKKIYISSLIYLLNLFIKSNKDYIKYFEDKSKYLQYIQSDGDSENGDFINYYISKEYINLRIFLSFILESLSIYSEFDFLPNLIKDLVFGILENQNNEINENFIENKFESLHNKYKYEILKDVQNFN